MSLSPLPTTGRTPALAACALAATAAMVTLPLAPEPAHAGGFFIPPHGVRVLGRGGAGVVGVWDLNALWYNPALLAGIETDNLVLVDATVARQAVTFSRAPRLLDNGEQLTFAPVDNDAAPLPIPQVGFASSFGVKGLHVAFGAFAPNGASSKYPIDGPQRYTIIDSEGSLFITTELAAAYQVTDWLWVGAGVQNMTVTLRLVNKVSGYPGAIGDAEDPDLDILLQTEGSAPFNLSGNLGAFIEPTDGLQFGLSVQLPVHIKDDDARVTQRLPDHVLFDQAEIKGDTVSSEFDFPWIFRGGVRYEAPSWDVELDVVHERWSSLDAIRTTPQGIEVQNVPGLGTIPVGALNIPRHFQDLWSLRLGSDVEVLKDVWTVRGGVALEQSAVPTRTLSVLQVDMNKLAIGLGASYQPAKDIWVDFGYAHVFYASADVTDSEVRQLNPTNAEGAVVVGNGRYEASADLGGAGVRIGF